MTVNKHVQSGDADAEVKRLMGESAELNSAQQEAEAHLRQSKHTIQELQSALQAAQVMGHAYLQHSRQFACASSPGPLPLGPCPQGMVHVMHGSLNMLQS